MSRFDRWALIVLLSLWAGSRPWDAFLSLGPAQVQLSALLIGLCLYAVCYLARPLFSHHQNFPDATVTMPPNLDPGSSLLLQSPVLGSWGPFGASILVAFFVVKAAGEALDPYYAKGFYVQKAWKGVPDYEPLVNFAAIFFLAYVLALLAVC